MLLLQDNGKQEKQQVPEPQQVPGPQGQRKQQPELPFRMPSRFSLLKATAAIPDFDSDVYKEVQKYGRPTGTFGMKGYTDVYQFYDYDG